MTGPSRRGIAALLVGCALVAAGAWPVEGAQGATVKVGSPLVGSFNTAVAFKEAAIVANTTLADTEANVTSPVSGRVVLWRMTGFSSTGPYKLRILHPLGNGKYVAAGTSSPQTRLGTTTEVFPTDLPIHAGDLIGLEGASTSDGYPFSSIAGSSFSSWPQLEEESAAAPKLAGSDRELGFNAQVQPEPGVSQISPASGPLSGGTVVTILGHDFTAVTAVSFGSTPAANFTVESGETITATSPPGAAPGAVDVSVIAAGGSSPPVATDRFTYLAAPASASCVVPNLKGRSLKGAKKRARKANCRIGKVKKLKGVGPKTGKVVKQKPKAGKVKAGGTKIAVTLG